MIDPSKKDQIDLIHTSARSKVDDANIDPQIRALVQRLGYLVGECLADKFSKKASAKDR
jgi:hypothetical protein